MELYVCWGTFQIPGVRSHPCREALLTLEGAGYSPEVVKVHGFGGLPDVTRGRREVKRLTGQSWVPVLLTDEGTVVQGTAEILDWAAGNPSPRAVPADPAGLPGG